MSSYAASTKLNNTKLHKTAHQSGTQPVEVVAPRYSDSTAVEIEPRLSQRKEFLINSASPTLLLSGLNQRVAETSASPLMLVTSSQSTWLVFLAAVFLVSVPVFIEAPLVRSLPWLSLAITAWWVWLSFRLMSRPSTYLWGDLLLGFSWSWLAGSIYWGWLRWEPLYHLPVESIGVPFALWCLWHNWGKVGNWFYLGSLFGTMLTDVYFYIVDLIPDWRQIMRVEPIEVPSILHHAVAQVQTPWGQSWALVLVAVLLVVGILPLRQKQRHWYAFSGAVFSTILVDSLFLLAALTA